MIITLSWLKDHLSTNSNLGKIISKLTDIGLEVEGIKENQGEENHQNPYYLSYNLALNSLFAE